jgi:hypothetical protein
MQLSEGKLRILVDIQRLGGENKNLAFKISFRVMKSEVDM